MVPRTQQRARGPTASNKPKVILTVQMLCQRHSAGASVQHGRGTAQRVFAPWPMSVARRAVIVAAADLEEIDPLTGQVISKTAASAPVAGLSINAGGFKWAYRRSTPDPAKASSDKPQVLLLHGLGSSSYSFRNTLGLLGGEGYDAFAPDWLGHGDSDKPAPSQFDFSEAAYLQALQQFIEAAGLHKPYALVVQGFVLSQYGLLHALEREADVGRLLVLNTPLSLKSKLRPELAAYKNPLPFLRPKAFDGVGFNASGSPYAMQQRDADVYARPYLQSPEASVAVAQTMDKLDWQALLRKVDEGYRSCRKPAVVLFGTSDPFLDITGVYEFLDSKRTNMKSVASPAKLGHMPQEDYAEALHEAMVAWLSGESDEWSSGKQMKMTKQGLVGM